MHRINQIDHSELGSIWNDCERGSQTRAIHPPIFPMYSQPHRSFPNIHSLTSEGQFQRIDLCLVISMWQQPKMRESKPSSWLVERRLSLWRNESSESRSAAMNELWSAYQISFIGIPSPLYNKVDRYLHNQHMQLFSVIYGSLALTH